MNNNITTPIPSVIENKEKLIFITNNFDYFRKSIEWNLKDNFYSKNPDKEYREDMLKNDFKWFISKIDMFRESIDDTYPDYFDFNFMEIYLTEIFMALYTNETLPNVFEDNETKEKFFNCMEKYFYWNFWKMSIELVQKYPKKDKWEQKKTSQILTDDEMKQLLDWIRED